jgi:hypothetical protein
VSAQPRMKLESAEPRIFGLVPPTLALVLGLGALIVGIIVLVAGALIAAGIWLAAALALIALSIEASRRWPASALPRLAVRVADGAGRHLGLARVTAGAWGEASRRVVSLRHELRLLRTEREARLAALGAAAYRDHDGEVRALRDRIASIDERIERSQRELEGVVARTRKRVQEERKSAAPTTPFAVAEEPPALQEDEKTRTAPTAARRRPTSPRSA